MSTECFSPARLSYLVVLRLDPLRRLVVFTIDDPEPLLLGDEPIYRDAQLAGRLTSGTYEIEIAAERYVATSQAETAL